MSISSVIALFGGLAFFLFGMSMMGESLKKIAGGRLRTVLGQLTSTPLKGVLLGTVVTAIIQSSSATSVMVVGFVNSGMMALEQAISIIMGANIGTTATGWILTLASVGSSGAASLLSSSTIFAVVAVIGIIMYMTAKKSQNKSVGVILLSLSVLMSGMKAMSSAMEPLQSNPDFLRIISVASNPVLCVVIGIAVTALIQSSSASVGILQALSISGVITYDMAIYMIIGMNIGACVPVLLSSVGTGTDGKRAAFTYLYFNLIGGVITVVVYLAAKLITGGIAALDGSATSVGIAVVNTVTKVLAVVVLFPFTGLMKRMAERTFPDKSAHDEHDEAELLDERFVSYPSVGLEQAFVTLVRMGEAARTNFTQSVGLFTKYDRSVRDRIEKREDSVDRYEDVLGVYLVKLSANPLNEHETHLSATILQSLTNLERISDHSMNLTELAEELYNDGVSFSEAAQEGLLKCMEAVGEILTLAMTALLNTDISAAEMVDPLEGVIDIMTDKLKAQHTARLQQGKCTLKLGFIFNDALSNLERIADHCSNIAIIVLENNRKELLLPHTYEKDLQLDTSTDHKKLTDLYSEKYLSFLN